MVPCDSGLFVMSRDSLVCVVALVLKSEWLNSDSAINDYFSSGVLFGLNGLYIDYYYNSVILALKHCLRKDHFSNGVAGQGVA